MTTIYRKLNLKEQAELWVLMKELKITQVMIANKNKISNMFISKICRGIYNITPRVKKQFLKVGIDLDVIMEGGE